MNDISDLLSKEILRLRQNGASDFEPNTALSKDEILYLRTEIIIRNDKYNEFFEFKDHFEDSFLQNLASGYYYLFTNPAIALDYINKLLVMPSLSENLKQRVKFWEMDAYFLKGDIDSGRNHLEKLIDPTSIDSIWKAECLAIYALVHYFTNDLDRAAFYHMECSNYLINQKDSFLQIFNASMALRVSLKKCDPASFDHFSEVLDNEIDRNHEKRYSLRIYAYKALIYNQLNDQITAEKYWNLADKLVPYISMKWEVGQYYLWRSVGKILSDDEFASTIYYQKAQQLLIESGSPKTYLAELELLRVLRPWGSPSNLAKGFRKLTIDCEKAIIYLKEKLSDERYTSVRFLLEEGVSYVENFLNGSQEQSYHSLVISIFKNKSRTALLQDNLRSSRKVQQFMSTLSEASYLTKEGIVSSYEDLYGRVELNSEGMIKFNKHQKDESVEREILVKFSNVLLTSTTSKQDASINGLMLAHDIKNSLLTAAGFLEVKNYTMASKTLKECVEICEEELKSEKLFSPFREVLKALHEKYLDKLIVPSIESEFIIKSIDSTRLCRLISNLTDNSLNAKSSEVIIDVDFNITKAIIKIQDNGPGFSNSVLKSIQNGQRISHTKGNGIGLLEISKIVAEIGGDIKFENTKVGGLVTLGLPLFDSSENVEINFLDDDKYYRLLLRNKFINQNVKIYKTGDELLESFDRSNSNNAIFCIDKNVNASSGIEILEILNSRGCSYLFLNSSEDVDLSAYPFILKNFEKKI